VTADQRDELIRLLQKGGEKPDFLASLSLEYL